MSPKQTIAHYRITAKLGEGGMGEVWRATDTKLDRDPRFEREAKILASLNHPQIAAIYGVEEEALVMELVEGESPKGPMPFEDACCIRRVWFITYTLASVDSRIM